MTVSKEPIGSTQKSTLTEDDNIFLRSVDLPDINPPPNWSGFTIKNLSLSQPSRDYSYMSLCGDFSSRYCIDIKPNPLGEVCVSGFADGRQDKNDALKFLQKLKKTQPQIEIIFTTELKSPSVLELAREGIRAVLDQIHRLRS